MRPDTVLVLWWLESNVLRDARQFVAEIAVDACPDSFGLNLGTDRDIDVLAHFEGHLLEEIRNGIIAVVGIILNDGSFDLCAQVSACVMVIPWNAASADETLVFGELWPIKGQKHIQFFQRVDSFLPVVPVGQQ